MAALEKLEADAHELGATVVRTRARPTTSVQTGLPSCAPTSSEPERQQPTRQHPPAEKLAFIRRPFFGWVRDILGWRD
jgi:hypothetical protein